MTYDEILMEAAESTERLHRTRFSILIACTVVGTALAAMAAWELWGPTAVVFLNGVMIWVTGMALFIGTKP